MLLALGMISLPGCARTVYEASPNPCGLIVLREYAPEFNMRLADEVVAASADTVWPQAVIDYAGLRDEVKACKGK